VSRKKKVGANLTTDEARAKLAEAVAHVDWPNVGRVCYTLSQGFAWGKYDNAYWRPNYNQILLDINWLIDNAEAIKTSLHCLKENK